MTKKFEGTAKIKPCIRMCFQCSGNNEENTLDDLQWEADGGWVHRLCSDQITSDFGFQYIFYGWWKKKIEELWAKRWHIQSKRISWTDSLENNTKALKVKEESIKIWESMLRALTAEVMNGGQIFFFFNICITISWTLDVRSGENMESRLTSSFLTLAHR